MTTTMNEGGFKINSDREYWVSVDGTKRYPHQFDDDHLKNTVEHILGSVGRLKFSQARALCVQHNPDLKQYDNMDDLEFFRHFQHEVDVYMSNNSGKEWLMANSKIYMLLMEEATYRGVRIDEAKKKPVKKYKNTVYASPRNPVSSFMFQGDTSF